MKTVEEVAAELRGDAAYLGRLVASYLKYAKKFDAGDFAGAITVEDETTEWNIAYINGVAGRVLPESDLEVLRDMMRLTMHEVGAELGLNGPEN